MSLDSMHKKLNDFYKKNNRFKKIIPQTKKSKDLKGKGLDNVGDLFNKLYYICKEIHNKEKKWFNYKRQKEI